MTHWQVSSCINEFIFDFSSLGVYGDDKREALKNYIEELKDYLDEVNIDDVLNNEDGEIWEDKDE
jgi:hypothetical protein